MIRTRLVLVNRQNVTVTQNANVAVFDDIPVSITYQIADVRFPEKRVGSNTKTVNIPGTQDVNLFFQNAYQANIALSTFNPKKKVDAIYYVNELVNFKGYLRLMKIVKNNVTGAVTYQCNIIGEVVNIFKDIENKYLTDLDFTSHPTLANYSHTLNKTFVTNSWTFGGTGFGYVYPLIDWGFDNSNMNFCQVKNLKACLFARDYLLRIFIAAGYTWTSTFLDSTFFKNLIIPPTETQSLSQSTIDNNKFGAEADGTQAATSNTLNIPLFPVAQFLSATGYTTVQFQNEVYDAGGIFATPNFTPLVVNKYNVTANIGIIITFKKNGVAQPGANFAAQNGALEVIVSGGCGGIMTIPATQLDFGGNSNNFTIAIPNVTVQTATNTKVSWRWQGLAGIIAMAGSGADTWTMETSVTIGSNFSAEFASNQVYEGAPVDPQTLIPADIKQGDFFSWIIRMFNLYVTVDRANSKNLIIETRNSFYLTTSRNWETLHDESKDDEVIPLGELDFFKATYSYSSDGDYYNKLHEDEMKEVYGYEEQIIQNDFNSNDSQTSVGFAPTPYYAVPNLQSMVIPAIITKENDKVSPFKPKIRILYWKGAVALPTGQWSLVSAGPTLTPYTSFPAAGHFDNPYNPTLDLNWGYPTQLYYNFPNLQVTNNNLFNKYYSKYINQISDKNSKIVQAYFKLSPRDIAIFDFRVPIFYDQAYWLVNKIVNYNPLVRQSTMVELLKLTAYDEFTPVSAPWNGGNNKDSTYSGARTAGDSIVKGTENTNLGNNSMIVGGSGNYIAPNADSVILKNCTNVMVSSDVVNFEATGLSNVLIDSSYNNSVKNASDEKTTLDNAGSPWTIDKTYNGKTVYIDASGGDVTLTFDAYNQNDLSLKAIRLDGSVNLVNVDSSSIYGTENYHGSALPYDITVGRTLFQQYASIDLTIKGDTIL